MEEVQQEASGNGATATGTWDAIPRFRNDLLEWREEKGGVI